jgi:hypothetical protein
MYPGSRMSAVPENVFIRRVANLVAERKIIYTRRYVVANPILPRIGNDVIKNTEEIELLKPGIRIIRRLAVRCIP